MKFFKRLTDKIRAKCAERGYTCDGCGKELFDCPSHRFCKECEGKLYKNDMLRCEKCGRKTVAEGICLNCKRSLPAFTKGISPFVYQGLASALVNRLKNGDRYLAYYFGERLSDCFLSSYTPPMYAVSGRSNTNDDTVYGLDGGDSANGVPMYAANFLLVPVPMTKKDEKIRGYNQATELAKAVETELKSHGVEAELDEDILLKVKQTLPQKKGTFSKRRENLLGAFHVHKRKKCKDRRILLIDDIMTTGATGSECAEKLIKAGAKEVVFLTVVSLAELK